MKIKHTLRKQPRIEMMPLIDVVFLLLVFFIYTMLSMAVHQGMDLDLPESSQALPTTETNPLSLSIQNGESGLEILLDKQKLSLSELPQKLQAAQQDQEPPQVLIFAEENISYQQLYMVLDELKKSKITDISLQSSSQSN